MIKVNNEIVEIKHFPDGTLNIKGDETLMGEEVIISWHYANDAEFMAVAFLTKFYQAHGCEVVLYMPYVPNARMDRVELAGDIFTMKYFGEMINSLNFKEVWVHDVHSSVAVAALKNVRFVHGIEFVNSAINYVMHTDGMPIIFFPDEGSMKRYNHWFAPFKKAFAVKNRDWSTGKITGLTIHGITEDEIKGMPIVIRDDICSYGGTFYHAAKKLKEMGAGNIYLLVTHCENNIHKGEFGDEKVNLLATGLIKKVFTTDSIYSLNGSPMVEVFYGELVSDNDDEEYDFAFDNDLADKCCEDSCDCCDTVSCDTCDCKCCCDTCDTPCCAENDSEDK